MWERALSVFEFPVELLKMLCGESIHVLNSFFFWLMISREWASADSLMFLWSRVYQLHYPHVFKQLIKNNLSKRESPIVYVHSFKYLPKNSSFKHQKWLFVSLCEASDPYATTGRISDLYIIRTIKFPEKNFMRASSLQCS